MKKLKYIMLALAVVSSTGSYAGWKVGRNRDEITDKITYTIKNIPVKQCNSYMDKSLIFSFTRQDDGKCEPQVIFDNDGYYIHRNDTTLTVRFDDDKPIQWQCSRSDNEKSLILDDPMQFIARTRTARRLIIRQNDDGDLLTTTLIVSGLDAELGKLPVKVNVGTGVSQDVDCHDAPKRNRKRKYCSFCLNKGTVQQKVDCDECNGTGSVVVPSEKRKHQWKRHFDPVLVSHPCPKCRGALGSTVGKMKISVPCPKCQNDEK